MSFIHESLYQEISRFKPSGTNTTQHTLLVWILPVTYPNDCFQTLAGTLHSGQHFCLIAQLGGGLNLMIQKYYS